MRKSEGGKEISSSNGEFKKFLFTGMFDAKPLIFNPTKEQLRELTGIKQQEELKYYNLQGDKGTHYTRMNLWCEINPRLATKNQDYPEKVYIKIEFNISKNTRISKGDDSTGKVSKTLFINTVANYDGIGVSWAVDESSIDTQYGFSKENVRESREGERLLINLLYALFYREATMDTPIRDFGILDTDWNDLCDGNIDELNNIIDPKNDASEQFRDKEGNINKFRVLLGVKTSDKGSTFMTVFTSEFDYCFAKAGRSLSKKLREKLTTLESPFKADFQKSFTAQEFDILKAAESKASQPSATVSNVNDQYNAYDTSMNTSHFEEAPF